MIRRKIFNKICFFPLLLTGIVGLASTLCAVSVDFDQATYTVRPGDSLDLVVSFSEPIPNGLLGYAIQLNFDTDVLAVNQITVPAELDFDFIDPPAARDWGSNFASIAGYTAFGEPAYTGTDFVTFSVTVPVAVAVGQYCLELSFLLLSPDAVNFIDGTAVSIDDTLVLGSATLVVDPPVVMENLTIAPDGANMRISFTGTPGHEYLVEYSTDLTPLPWTPLETVVAPVGGLVEVFDVKPVAPNKRFYRIDDQLVAAAAAETVIQLAAETIQTENKRKSSSPKSVKSGNDRVSR